MNYDDEAAFWEQYKSDPKLRKETAVLNYQFLLVLALGLTVWVLAFLAW